MRSWQRTARWAVVALAAVITAGCGSTGGGDGAGTTTTAGTPGTTAAGCPPFGGVSPESGPAAAAGGGSVLLRNVQVQAGRCVDEVAFLFWKGAPAWSAAYQDGPLTADPSGQPVVVGGAAHLVVVLHASGVDQSVDPPRQSYDGPAEMTPGAPSGVMALQRLGDFEGITTWAVGLPERRGFEVVRRGDQLVLRLAASTPRSTRCTAPGAPVSVGYPAGWYAELSPRWPCRFLAPQPFVVYPATDAMDWAVTAQDADAPASTVVSRMTSGGSVRVGHARVAGLDATVLDVTESGPGLYPAGYGYRMYVLPTSPVAFLISGRPLPPVGQPEGRAEVDRIAALATIP